MFNIEEVLGIKRGKNIKALETLFDTILLIPEALSDTISKINNLGFPNASDLNFINGYALVDKNSYINRRGETIKLNDVRLTGNFSCGFATSTKGFVNGKTGGQLYFKKNPLTVKSFSEGVAPVEVAPGEWNYINADTEIQHWGNFVQASCFFGGYAIVQKKDYGSGLHWEIIDRDFHAVKISHARSEREYYEKLLFFFDHNPNLSKIDSNIKKTSENYNTIFIDIDTGFSIRIYALLDAISKHFGIPLCKGSVKGVKISNKVDKGTISFSPEDIELIRLREKKEEQNA